MKRIGQEITFGEVQAAVLPRERTRRSAHVLDLRPAAGSPNVTVPAEEKGTSQSARRGELTAKKKRSGLLSTLQRLSPRRLPLSQIFKAAIVLAGAIFFLSLDISLAERFIGIYLVAAIVYAIDSQRTFLVALVFLIMVAVWSALGNSVSAEDYATYAFYFLAIGLVTAIREMLTGKNQPLAEH